MPITSKDFQALQPGVGALIDQQGANKRASQEAALRAYLQQQEQGSVDPSGAYTPGTKARAQQAEQDRNLQTAENVVKQGAGVPGRKLNARIGDVDISEAQQMTPVMANLAMDKLKQNKTEALSKRYENLTDFNSAIQDVEKLSDTGQGGILTNPNAQLPGTGKVQSAVPDSLMGLAEAVGAAPKGSSEMRKSLARLQLGYARALGGARGVNPMMIQKEKEAMGYIASGDSELVKKGVLSLAENVKNHFKVVQSGYSPDVINTVHQSLGGDPLDAYSHIPSTGPAGQPVAQPAAPAPATAAPQPTPQQPDEAAEFQNFYHNVFKKVKNAPSQPGQ